MTPDAVRAAVEECKRLAEDFASENAMAAVCKKPAGRTDKRRTKLHAAIEALASLHAPDAVSPVVLPAEPLGAPAKPSGSRGCALEPLRVSTADAAPIPGAEDGWVQVGSILSGHLRPQPEPWCRSMLLYSPKNAGDSPENRVMLYAASTPPPRVEPK